MSRAFVRTWLKGGEVYVIKEHEAFPFDSYSPSFNDRRGARCGGVQLLQNGRCYGCCVCIGSAGTAIMGLFALMKSDNGVVVNLYNDCRFTTDKFGERVRLDMRADPYDPKGAKIAVKGAGQRFSIALRIPAWADKFSVMVNGEGVGDTAQDGYLVLDRVWHDDKIEIRFTAPVKMRVINGKIAFTKGPIVLASDVRHRDPAAPISLAAKDGRTVRAKRVKNTVFDSNAAYEILTPNCTLTLTDYAQSGKNFDDETTGLTVWHVKK